MPLRIGGHLSLEHSPALHVTTIPTGGIKVATADAVAEINVIRSELDETDGLASVEEMMATMTRVRQREAVTYRVAGRDVTGTRLHTDTAMLDLLVASAGKGRQLRVMVTASSSVTDVEPLRAVVETITFAKRAPAPHVTITAHGPAGDVSADATLGKAVTVAGEKVTFAKRATVREQLRTMRFEHAPELTARLVTGMRPPTVGLFFGSVTVHAVLLPRSITSTDLLAELEVRVSGIVPLSRTVAGYTYPGIATDSLPGGFPLRTHVYWLEREGRHFAVAITAPPDDVTKREPLVDAILTTLR